MWKSIVAVLIAIAAAKAASAYTPESPEVRKMIDAGLKYLETVEETRLGGKCLIATAFVKDDRRDHPWIKKAVEACQKATQSREEIDMYSNGMAIIFLCELDAKKYRPLIDYYLRMLAQRQKPHGGWGYTVNTTGDTSQSQYGALSLWEAHSKGIPINPAMGERFANWILATQDPSGAWGYQGKVGNGKRVEQHEISCSMVAAGMGSLLICADLYGIIERGESLDANQDLPEGMVLAVDKNQNRAPRMRSSSINKGRVLKALNDGDAWMEENYTVSMKKWTFYYLYAMERYRSFQEFLTGVAIEEPEWYNNGVKYAMESQRKPGMWSNGCGSGPDTAFTVLFLLRSTAKALKASLGEGISIGGVGLPPSGSLKMRNGELVGEQPKTGVDGLVDLIDDAQLDRLEGLIEDPDAILVDASDSSGIRKLEQMARNGPWQARVVAVKALAKTGDLDRVPVLLYALSDPQPDVVLAARDGLKFVSRRFKGYGPPDDFALDAENNKDRTRRLQYDALNKWKKWYKSIRPDAAIVVE